MRQKNIAVIFDHYIYTFRVICSANNSLLVKITLREQGIEVDRFQVQGAQLQEIWEKWRNQGINGHVNYGLKVRPCIQLEKNHDAK